jgi:hypothetical protein
MLEGDSVHELVPFKLFELPLDAVPPPCRWRESMDTILVVNAVSSSVKFQVFSREPAGELINE